MEKSNRELRPGLSGMQANQQADFNPQHDFFFNFGGSSKKPFFGPSRIQAKLFIGETNDSTELEANRMAEGYTGHEAPKSNSTLLPVQDQTIRRNVQNHSENQGIPIQSASLEHDLNASKGSGKALDDSPKKSMESYFNTDFSSVRIHTDERAQSMNQQVGAHAFTHGSDVYFNSGKYNTSSTEGKKLLAHELTHVTQQRSTKQINRVTGQDAQNRVTELLKQQDQLKVHTDVVRVALKEIKAKKSRDFNKQEIIKNRLPQIAKLLLTESTVMISAANITAKTTELINEWSWLTDNIGAEGYSTKQSAFFSKITKSTISTIREDYPKSIMHDKIRSSDASVFDLIIKHVDADIDAAQLYAYASNEGLSDLIKDAGVTGKALTAKPVSGFSYLGMDDFVSDFEAKRKPVKDFLPAGFEMQFNESVHVNEKGREVRSADFANLDTALQALKASIKRRRTLFLEDAKINGYANPTLDEKVYWTYLYYNPGEFGGKAQLEKYKKGNEHKQTERKLSDWITKGEYADAQRVLQGYKTIVSMKIFR